MRVMDCKARQHQHHQGDENCKTIHIYHLDKCLGLCSNHAPLQSACRVFRGAALPARRPSYPLSLGRALLQKGGSPVATCKVRGSTAASLALVPILAVWPK